MRKQLRKLAALAISAIFTVSLLPMTLAAGASEFNDVTGHWGEAHLTKMIESGVIAGDGNGNAMPDKNLERYEAAIMLAKVFGLNNLDLADAVSGKYSDITAASIYVEEYINNIIAAGFMVGGDGRFDSSRLIPREDAFTAIRNAFQLPDAPSTFTSVFPDYDDVAGWAKGHIAAMEYAGMIAGNEEGNIAPKDTVTRAEFAALLSKGVGTFIDADTDFEDAELDLALIRNPGLTVENLTVEVLTIAQGVGGGDVTLANCDIGTLHVRGGGGDSIHLIGTNVTELIIDTTVTGSVRVYVDADSIVELVKIYSEGATLDIDGDVYEVKDYTDGDDGDDDGDDNGDDNGDDTGDDDEYDVTVNTVNPSVTADVTVGTNGFTITLTGELDYEDNVFLARSASDFETVVGADGRPLEALLGGAYTAIEINVKEIMAVIGFEFIDTLQVNPALETYGQIGNITENAGEWSKESPSRAPAGFDDEYTVLILGGETATLTFTCADTGDVFTVTIDATGLTVNGAV